MIRTACPGTQETLITCLPHTKQAEAADNNQDFRRTLEAARQEESQPEHEEGDLPEEAQPQPKPRQPQPDAALVIPVYTQAVPLTIKTEAAEDLPVGVVKIPQGESVEIPDLPQQADRQPVQQAPQEPAPGQPAFSLVVPSEEQNSGAPPPPVNQAPITQETETEQNLESAIQEARSKLLPGKGAPPGPADEPVFSTEKGINVENPAPEQEEGPLYIQKPQPLEVVERLLPVIRKEEPEKPLEAAALPEAAVEPAPVRQAALAPELPRLPVELPPQAEQISLEVVNTIEQGRTECTLRLEPRELGPVQLRVVLEEGKLSVEIRTESNKTTQLLTRQMDAIGSALEKSGLDLERLQIVEQSSASQKEQASGQGQPQQERQGEGRQNSPEQEQLREEEEQQKWQSPFEGLLRDRL